MWLKEWKKDVKELEAKVRDIKGRLRKDWSVSYPTGKYPGEDQFNLLKLKHDLTHLYQYRAAHRGKTHAELPNYFKAPDTSKYDKLKILYQQASEHKMHIHH